MACAKWWIYRDNVTLEKIAYAQSTMTLIELEQRFGLTVAGSKYEEVALAGAYFAITGVNLGLDLGGRSQSVPLQGEEQLQEQAEMPIRRNEEEESINNDPRSAAERRKLAGMERERIHRVPMSNAMFPDNKQYGTDIILNDKYYNELKELRDDKSRKLDNLKKNWIMKKFQQKAWQENIDKLEKEIKNIDQRMSRCTMKNSGCYINAITNILNYNGINITPAEIDQILDTNSKSGGYLPNSSYVADVNSLLEVIGEKYNVNITYKAIDYSSADFATQRQTLVDKINAGQPVIVRFSENATPNGEGNPGGMHFATVYGYKTIDGEVSSFLMTDPGSNVNYEIPAIDFSYQKDIYRVPRLYNPPRTVYRIITIDVIRR